MLVLAVMLSVSIGVDTDVGISVGASVGSFEALEERSFFAGVSFAEARTH